MSTGPHPHEDPGVAEEVVEGVDDLLTPDDDSAVGADMAADNDPEAKGPT